MVPLLLTHTILEFILAHTFCIKKKNGQQILRIHLQKNIFYSVANKIMGEVRQHANGLRIIRKSKYQVS